MINLGNGEEHQVRRVVQSIYELAESSVRPAIGALPYSRGEVMRFYGDHAKARKLLGWSPVVTLEEGLRKTIAWYRNARDG